MVFVFKTSVRAQSQISKLKPELDKTLPDAKWNFDLEDRDKILRVESDNDIVSQTINLLKCHNFFCEELE